MPQGRAGRRDREAWRLVGGSWREVGGTVATHCPADTGMIEDMSQSRIVQLRQERGWTQERLASESGVGVRTIQRLESGTDTSLETLSLVADALNVPARELFVRIDDAALSARVESMEDRTAAQQLARNRTRAAWLWLFVGVALGHLVIEPHLDKKLPLSKSKSELRNLRTINP